MRVLQLLSPIFLPLLLREPSHSRDLAQSTTVIPPQARAAWQFIPIAALVTLSQLERLVPRRELYRLAGGPLRTMTTTEVPSPRRLVSVPRPRPAPICRNIHVHPIFKWSPMSPAPVPLLAQRSCPPSSVPIFHGDERTYVHPSIPPFPLPAPTNVAHACGALLFVLFWISGKALDFLTAPICLVVLACGRSPWLLRRLVIGVLAIGTVARFKLSNDVNIHLAILAAGVVGFVFGDVEVQHGLQDFGTAVCS
jgi:hypothetical protein